MKQIKFASFQITISNSIIKHLSNSIRTIRLLKLLSMHDNVMRTPIIFECTSTPSVLQGLELEFIVGFLDPLLVYTWVVELLFFVVVCFLGFFEVTSLLVVFGMIHQVSHITNSLMESDVLVCGTAVDRFQLAAEVDDLLDVLDGQGWKTIDAFVVDSAVWKDEEWMNGCWHF